MMKRFWVVGPILLVLFLSLFSPFSPDAVTTARAAALPTRAQPVVAQSGAGPGEPMTTMRNPAAVYCTALGYVHQVVADPDGSQHGVCLLPDDTSCDSWAFLEGRCGRAHNACAREGLKTTTQATTTSAFTTRSAVCVDGRGRQVASAEEVVNLIGRASASRMAGEPGLQSSIRILERFIPPANAVERSTATVTRQTADLPAAFSWRDYDGQDWMTPVKNQGGCGSCWAFAAVGAAEAVTNIAQWDADLDPDMSEQYLVADCSTSGNCAGGWGASALWYIMTDGVPDEACLAYRDGNRDGCSYTSGGCNADLCTYSGNDACSDYQCGDRCSDWESRLHSLENVAMVWSPTRDQMKDDLLRHGPLLVALDMRGGFGDNGIYQCSSATSVNHSVVIVGYDDAGGYWIVRNSWGSGWNGDGYFKVAYGSCLIEAYYTYADAQLSVDAYEPNHTPETATPIAAGDVVTATICGANDQDTYAFSAQYGDRVVVDVDAAALGSALDAQVVLLGGDGVTVLSAGDDPYRSSVDAYLAEVLYTTGTYYVRVRDADDEGGPDYTYTLRMSLEPAAPTSVGPIVEVAAPASGSWLDPLTQTLTVDTSDVGSDFVSISAALYDGTTWHPLDSSSVTGLVWSHTFSTAHFPEAAGAYELAVTAYDWLGQSTSATVVGLGIDRTPPERPVVAVTAPDDGAPGQLQIAWQPTRDTISGVAAYDVQVRDAQTGAWRDLLTGTPALSTTYTGEAAQTYQFRVRAHDAAGNTGAFSDIAAYALDAADLDDRHQVFLPFAIRP